VQGGIPLGNVSLRQRQRQPPLDNQLGVFFMTAKIIDCSDSKKEEERIKYLEDWVEMQFWMYEQDLRDQIRYFSDSRDTVIESEEEKE
jgi:hypothetical protein